MTSTNVGGNSHRHVELNQVESPRGAFHRLLILLPRLQVNDAGIDFLRSSSSVLLELAERSEACVAVTNQGIAAVGELLALAAHHIEARSTGSQTVEALGWLVAELGLTSAFCAELAISSRQGNTGVKGASKCPSIPVIAPLLVITEGRRS